MSKLRRARPERLLRRHTELCEFAPKDASQAWNIGRTVESCPKMEGVEKRANLNRQQREGGLATHSQSTTSKAGSCSTETQGLAGPHSKLRKKGILAFAWEYVNTSSILCRTGTMEGARLEGRRRRGGEAKNIQWGPPPMLSPRESAEGPEFGVEQREQRNGW